MVGARAARLHLAHIIRHHRQQLRVTVNRGRPEVRNLATVASSVALVALVRMAAMVELVASCRTYCQVRLAER